MKLPNAINADFIGKLENYCLNPHHDRGKDKASLFQEKLGITLQNSDILSSALQNAIITEEATLHKSNDYGTYYNLRFFLKTEMGESWILSAWIIRKSEDFPRLVSCYPVKK